MALNGLFIVVAKTIASNSPSLTGKTHMTCLPVLQYRELQAASLFEALLEGKKSAC